MFYQDQSRSATAVCLTVGLHCYEPFIAMQLRQQSVKRHIVFVISYSQLQQNIVVRITKAFATKCIEKTEFFFDTSKAIHYLRFKHDKRGKLNTQSAGLIMAGDTFRDTTPYVDKVSFGSLVTRVPRLPVEQHAMVCRR